MLDRGEQLDWFDSLEICIEAIGCLIATAFFIGHTWTASGASFFNRALLHDRNFIEGRGKQVDEARLAHVEA